MTSYFEMVLRVGRLLDLSLGLLSVALGLPRAAKPNRKRERLFFVRRRKELKEGKEEVSHLLSLVASQGPHDRILLALQTVETTFDVTLGFGGLDLGFAL